MKIKLSMIHILHKMIRKNIKLSKHLNIKYTIQIHDINITKGK